MLLRIHGIFPVLIPGHLLAILMVLFPISANADDDLARLLIYLEVPESVAATEITLEGLDIRSGERSVGLSLNEDQLVSEKLAGGQILLSLAEVPAGLYTSLDFSIARIAGKVGVAEVTPAPPPGGLSLPLTLQLQTGQVETIFLTWRPAPVDPEAKFHSPDFRLNIPTVPPFGSLAFVTSAGAGAIIIIDRLKSSVVGAIKVDEDPRGLAYSRNNNTLFVALAGQDAIAVVDLMSLRVIKTIPLQFGDDPTRLLLSQDESSLFVLCPGSRALVSLSVWSLQEQFRLAVGNSPRSLAQDPASLSLFVACEDEGRIQVVDPRSGTITSSLTLLPAPVEVVVDEQSGLLFLGGSAQRRIRSFDLVSEETGGDQNVCGPIAGLAVNTRTRRLYASVPACRNLAVVRPDIGIEFGSVPLPGKPSLMDFDQEFRQLWVVMPQRGAVAVCNANRGQLETVIEVGAEPFEVLAP